MQRSLPTCDATDSRLSSVRGSGRRGLLIAALLGSPLAFALPTSAQARLDCPASWEELGFHQDQFGWTVSTHAADSLVTLGNGLVGLLYTRGDDGIWTGTAGFSAGPTPGPGPWYGALGEDLAAIGDPRDSTLNFAGQGAVALWERSGETWSSGGVLYPPVAQSGMQFGASLSIAPGSSRIAVGAPLKGAGKGAAYVFERVGSEWSLLGGEIKPAGLPSEARFGTALVMRDDWLFVGAPANHWSDPGAGEVYALREDAGVWTLVDVLQAPVPEVLDQFGRVLEFDGSQLFVAGPGQVYVYEFDGTDWNPTTPILPQTPDGAPGFGAALDVQGDRLTVGGSGRFFEFARVAGDWEQRYFVDDTSEASWGLFGSVALTPDGVATSTPYFDENGFEYPDNPGKVYWFDTSDATQAMAACGHHASLSNPQAMSERLALHVPTHPDGAYLVLGSFTGQGPIPLGFGALPLTPDAYFALTVSSPNSPVLPTSFGVLDADGRGSTDFVVPNGMDPSLAGVELHHAALLASAPGFGLDAVTNAVTIVLTP